MSSKCAYEIDLSSILSSLITIAKAAGQTIITSTPPPSSTATATKLNSADLVTETDKAVEKQISTYLLARYPTFKFIGEETYEPGQRVGKEPTFVVDPIDGTTNFVHRFSFVAVSLGFCVDGEPVVGCVFAPFMGTMWAGVKGQGSWKQELEYITGVEDMGEWVERRGKQRVELPLKEPAPFEGLSGSLVAVEWGSDRTGSNWECKMKTWNNLGRSKEEGGAMVHSGRSLGSAALNICQVAEGTIDMYWEGGCWAWDVCAGWVILKEAGGIMVDGNPGQWEIPVEHRKYLAVRGAKGGQKEIVEEFWSHVVGKMAYES